MKLSNLLAASLTVLSAVAVFASTAEARNPAKDIINTGGPTVFAAECGTDPLTQARFGPSTPGNPSPLLAQVNESTLLTSGYAGGLVFVPFPSDITNPATFTAFPQGNLTEQVVVNPNSSSFTGTPALASAVLYSWLNVNEQVRYGISFINATLDTPLTNHAIKGKSILSNVTIRTDLQNLRNEGLLVNQIGNNPGNNAHNFQLLGIATALTNLAGAGTAVQATFNSFALNNGTIQLPKATGDANGNAININCAGLLPLTPVNAAAASRSQ